MFRRIAVALDSSEDAERILNFAKSLVKPATGRLDLIQVHEEARPGDELEALPIYGWEQIVEYDDELDLEQFQEEQWRLQQMADRVLQETGVFTEVHVLRGKPAETLNEYAHATNPDLLVAATRPHHRPTEQTAGALVRRSAAPLLLLRGGARPEPVRMSRILVPLDGSVFSAAIMAPVIALAHATGAAVSLLECPPEGMASVLFHSSAHGREFLEALSATFPADLPRPELRRPVSSDPATAILREVQRGYDVIAMATHGWGGAWDWLLGNTAGKVMQATELPVLAYHPVVMHARPEQLAH